MDYAIFGCKNGSLVTVQEVDNDQSLEQAVFKCPNDTEVLADPAVALKAGFAVEEVEDSLGPIL